MASFYGALAQLGERNTGSVEVSGSIPLGSTKFRLAVFVSRSSSGLGHRPFTAVTGVRVPYGMPHFIHKMIQKSPTSPELGFFVPVPLPNLAASLLPEHAMMQKRQLPGNG